MKSFILSCLLLSLFTSPSFSKSYDLNEVFSPLLKTSTELFAQSCEYWLNVKDKDTLAEMASLALKSPLIEHVVFYHLESKEVILKSYKNKPSIDLKHHLEEASKLDSVSNQMILSLPSDKTVLEYACPIVSLKSIEAGESKVEGFVLLGFSEDVRSSDPLISKKHSDSLLKFITELLAKMAEYPIVVKDYNWLVNLSLLAIKFGSIEHVFFYNLEDGQCLAKVYRGISRLPLNHNVEEASRLSSVSSLMPITLNRGTESFEIACPIYSTALSGVSGVRRKIAFVSIGVPNFPRDPYLDVTPVVWCLEEKPMNESSLILPENDIYKETLKAANAGDSNAQFRLGNMWYYTNPDTFDSSFEVEVTVDSGDDHLMFLSDEEYSFVKHGIGQDYERAFHWYKKSAEQGHVDAQVKLAYMHLLGKGCIINNHRAFEWFKKSAEQNHPLALHNVAIFYINGLIFPSDPKMHFEYLEKAAKLGYPLAMMDIAHLYESDTSIPENFKWAYVYYQLLDDPEGVERMKGQLSSEDLKEANKIVEERQKLMESPASIKEV